MSLQIFISVRNSYYMESIINQKQKFITTKEDKLNTGALLGGWALGHIVGYFAG